MGSSTTPGEDIQLEYEGDDLTSGLSPLTTDQLELGLFVDHEGAIDDNGLPGIQTYGRDQDLDPNI